MSDSWYLKFGAKNYGLPGDEPTKSTKSKKQSYYIPASQWLELPDEYSRWYYHPRKLTVKELQELKRGVQSDDPKKAKAPLPWWEVRYAVERVNRARDQLKRDALTRTQKIKIVSEATNVPIEDIELWSKTSLRVAYKGLFEEPKEGKGHTENLYWYLHAAKSADIEPDLIERLADMHEKLSPAELDQLYRDLPDLTLYYQSVKGTRGKEPASQEAMDDAADEWNELISELLDEYDEMIDEREDSK